MDEKQLMDMLSAVKAPAPNDNAKAKAAAAAMEAFEKNIVPDAQEDADEHRPTGRSTNKVGRFLMQKRYVLSSAGGAIALTAMLVVLGSPFILNEMRDMEVNKSIVGAGAVDAKVNVGTEETDAAYKRKVEKQNKELGQTQAQNGASFMPTPVGPAENTTLAVPATPAAPKGDALAEWRAKSEAKSVKREEAAAPEEKPADMAKQVPMAKAPAAVQAQSSTTFRTMSQNVAPAMPPVPSNEPLKKTDSRDAARAHNAFGGAAPVLQDKDIAIAGKVIAQPPVAMPVPAPGLDNYNNPYYRAQGDDQFPNYDDNAVTEVAAAPVSTFSVDVDSSSYSLIRRMINGGQLPPKGVVRLEELINYFPYSYAVPESKEEPFKPTVAVYNCPWKQGDKLVHIGIKGFDLHERPKSNIVFLIDTSGSMDEPDKLPLLISSFKLMLDSLKPDDTVGIVTYAGNAGVALEPTPASEKSKIIGILDRLQAGGSTAGAEGIKTAYELADRSFIKDGNNRVILATDGDFNVGISNQDDLKSFITRMRDKGIYLSTMGFGMGNYHDNTMQTLAQNGNGNAAYIDNLNEARKVLVEESTSTLFTIAKDVKIQVEFNPKQVQEYRLLGYETRHLNREDFNNDKVDAGEIGAGHAVTAIYEITPVGATPVVDNLRYAAADATKNEKAEDDKTQFPNELAFLKIRYKRPNEDMSRLMTRPITTQDEKKFDQLPDDIRFAAAVAGFGQLLRGNQYTGSLSWDQVIDMANNARGADEFGYRTEFVNLVRLAKSEAGASGNSTAPTRGEPGQE